MVPLTYLAIYRQVTTTNCDAAADYNAGCGTSFTRRGSYGTLFNKLGGGWYVLKRAEAQGASIYFWSRDDPSVPPEVKLGLYNVYPDASWGEPDARPDRRSSF